MYVFPHVSYLDYTKLYWSTEKFYKLAYTWKQKMPHAPAIPICKLAANVHSELFVFKRSVEKKVKRAFKTTLYRCVSISICGTKG